MKQVSSASSGAIAHWDYIRTGLGRSGRSLSENNFAKERRDWLAILLREVLQNALDARTPGTPTVLVTLRRKSLSAGDAALLDSLIPKQHLARFEQSVPHLAHAQASNLHDCLVVEDFGTSGLTGSIDEPELDGKGQNWNAFWYREGEGGKENSSGNGGAGQGKITYFSTSAIRTIFAYTVRADDGAQAIFGASSFLRDYSYADRKWKRDAYWGIWQGDGVDRVALPDQDPVRVAAFCAHLGLERTGDQCGLSLIIPGPKTFEMAEALQIVIAEFFVPIFRGDLAVRLEDTTVNKSTVEPLADQFLSDARARALHTCTTQAYRHFLVEALKRSSTDDLVIAKQVASASQIGEATFEPAELDTMRTALESEQAVSVRFPLVVKPKAGPPIVTSFDVHLMAPFDLEQPEQAVIRRDLLIGEEPIGGGKLRQRARGLTLISSDDLSRLLLSAEEATHLRWNARLPRLGEYYKSGADVVALVRNAMVKLLEVLTGGDQKRDFKLLSKYFAAPGASPAAQAKGKKSPDGKQIPDIANIPPPPPRLLAIEPTADGCRIRPAKAGALINCKLPLKVTVEFAYEGLDKDAFNEYDPLDFDLSEDTFSFLKAGCSVNQRSLNVLGIQVDEPDFELVVGGFDKNLRLRMRLTYEEASDAATVDAE